MTWREAPEPEFAPPRFAGWLRVVARGVPLAILVCGGFALLMLIRLFERPVFGEHRPVTPHITRVVFRSALWVMGIGFKVTGTPMRHPGGVVCNHSSWLDIFALNAAQQVYFVSKDAVAGWPGIGWMARGVGTVFIRRRARDAGAQKTTFETRLQAGHKLLFFPEGTSSDGQQVLPFKSTLFAAFFSDDLRAISSVQPVSLRYFAPPHAPARFYCWWGDMEFAPHLLQVLAAPRQGRISLAFHAPFKVAEFADRKTLSVACEEAVRSGFTALGPSES